MGPLNPKRCNIFNISPVLSTFRKQIEHFPCFVNVKCFFFFCFLRKMPKTGEMLNMLDMLNRWGEMGHPNPKKFNIFNISPVLSIFPKNI